MIDPCGEFEVALVCGECGAPMVFDENDDELAVKSKLYAEVPMVCTECDNKGYLELTVAQEGRVQ
jgi:hypothetical protein